MIQKNAQRPPRFGRFVRFEEQDQSTPQPPELSVEEETNYWYGVDELKTMKNIYLVEVRNCHTPTPP